MAPSDDLIDFDIIETHKENIQSLPGGRSAKALASTYAPLALGSKFASPGDTRNLNDAIREEYEQEILVIADSDDPLDVYDRYVKWTLNAYPSAQATPESQLRPLLERATKAFQTVTHYKNDPRYLKLWLNYIRFFSDAPRETFAYLARHSIGEGLALFYEEFAVWLESAGRWTQAEEVYKLGIEREARPTERLARKFGEFQHRYENRPQDVDEPSSPALPTVRPALAAKVDPFALSTPRPADPQAPRSNGFAASSTTRGGRQKLAIFSDADAPASNAKGPFGDVTKGWDNIGSISDRRKENIVEARPWTGETLKAGKKLNGPPKMMIFKDESTNEVPQPVQIAKSNLADQQQITNPKTGKTERVYVNLEAVYPNPDDPTEEFSFEELRAKFRGWTDRDWTTDRRRENLHESRTQENTRRLLSPEESKINLVTTDGKQQAMSSEDTTEHIVDSVPIDDVTQGTKARKSRRTKVMEVRAETQTIKTNLESPTGPKLKRKNSAEPTMTLHTKAATDDILDIFNQPLRNMGPLSNQPDSAGESEFEDDDYTSAGESTGTGAISGASEFGDDDMNEKPVADHEVSAGASASPWSEFTASKHVPHVGDDDELHDHERTAASDNHDFVILEDADVRTSSQELLVTPIETESTDSFERPRFVPIPPEDYEPPTRPYRDPSQVAQNRLPFMTPIVEKTESSMGALTIREEKDYFNSKTPSRQHGDGSKTCEEEEDDLLCTPFQEIVNDARVNRSKEQSPKVQSKVSKPTAVPSKPKPKGPVIKDTRCNPMDDSIKDAILDLLRPGLSSYPGYHDHRPRTFNKAPELRKFIRALAKTSKSGSDKTTTSCFCNTFSVVSSLS
ncbi:protein kinase [Xanthoria parietina]